MSSGTKWIEPIPQFLGPTHMGTITTRLIIDQSHHNQSSNILQSLAPTTRKEKIHLLLESVYYTLTSKLKLQM